MKVRIEPLDKIFSSYIRLRDKVCQRCLSPGNSIAAAHFHGRGSKSVRWDEDNACALCMGCHTYLDSHPLEKVWFFRVRLGKKGFDLLNSRYRITWPKPDKKMLGIYYRQKIKELEA